MESDKLERMLGVIMKRQGERSLALLASKRVADIIPSTGRPPVGRNEVVI